MISVFTRLCRLRAAAKSVYFPHQCKKGLKVLERVFLKYSFS
jgi:hypothetical protein